MMNWISYGLLIINSYQNTVHFCSMYYVHVYTSAVDLASVTNGSMGVAGIGPTS